MTVYLGNYVIPTDNGAAYQRQRDIIKSAIQTYGTDHIEGVTVGNEFMLKYGYSSAAKRRTIDTDGTVISTTMVQRTPTARLGIQAPRS